MSSDAGLHILAPEWFQDLDIPRKHASGCCAANDKWISLSLSSIFSVVLPTLPVNKEMFIW